ncbi:MAG TPA: hypothetical protein VHB21_02725 [Minicystis sp.]|nr:hypothetical protein [Minicystis sp.]
MRRALRVIVFLACVGFSVAGAYNVMSDNADVEHMAQAVACGDQGAGCRAQKTMMERTPFAQTFDFATPKRSVGVRCTRSLILVGDYACALR